MDKGKIIILSAPSGCGKSTIIAELMKDKSLRLGFSISCTSRQPRGEEKDGVNYYFISDEEFLRRIDADDFVEWEEVYPGTHYGTLKSEVERVTANGDNLLLDIDVKGALNVKKIYGDRAKAIFIEPPSIEELERRLRGRGTDPEEKIVQRLSKAQYELSFADEFDFSVVNDDLATAVEEVRNIIK